MALRDDLTEADIQRLVKQDRTIQSLWSNPKAKKKILEAYKEHDPSAKIPELEIEEAARAPVMALEQTVKDLQKQMADDKAEREKEAKLNTLSTSVEKGRQKLRAEGWTDEGIAAVDKLMEERGILDVEMAAAYYEKQNPPQAPANPRGVGAWNFVEQVQDNEADLKKLLESKGGNESLSDKMARDALNEFRGATRR